MKLYGMVDPRMFNQVSWYATRNYC